MQNGHEYYNSTVQGYFYAFVSNFFFLPKVLLDFEQFFFKLPVLFKISSKVLFIMLNKVLGSARFILADRSCNKALKLRRVVMNIFIGLDVTSVYCLKGY